MTCDFPDGGSLLLTSVRFHVAVQITGLCKSHQAQVTLIWLLSCKTIQLLGSAE